MARNISKLSAAILLSLASPLFAHADIAEEARMLMEEGKEDEAFELVTEELRNNPKGKQTGVLNALAGECLYLAEAFDEAAPYLETARNKGVAEAYLTSARIAMKDYGFAEAAEFYTRYAALKEKEGKEVDADAARERREVELAQDMLERVEDITVIDRIDVDPADFFTHYLLSPETGSLLPSPALSKDYSDTLDDRIISPVFQNERGDFRLWAMRDSDDGPISIYESDRFVDGEWDAPRQVDEVLNGGGDAAYPFMMADGSTLYFASDGEGSIGGYDIFRSNRDSSTGEYKAPVNMGMPYNSPYDDYMLVIDESTGAGWWATDRNHLPDGCVSIYVFIPNEVRKNYDSSTPELISYAMLDDYANTQGDADNKLIEETLARIEELENRPEEKSVQFRFPIGNGMVHTSVSDFKSAKGKRMIQEWQKRNDRLNQLHGMLSEKRRQYASAEGDKTIGGEILELEDRIEKESKELNRLRGEIVQAEK